VRVAAYCGGCAAFMRGTHSRWRRLRSRH